MYLYILIYIYTHSTYIQNLNNKYIFIIIYIMNILGFPGDSDGKESACNAGDPGSIPG